MHGRETHWQRTPTDETAATAATVGRVCSRVHIKEKGCVSAAAS